jgi:5'-nucleotidase
MKKPLILITNDDGYRSGGITALIEAAKPFGDIVVVAPNNSQSAKSHAITVKDFIRLTLVSKEDGLTIYRSSGTPVDCIKLAIQELKLKPDLLLSGVNHGINSSISVHYSGTMGATKEGCILGIPSIGFSLNNFSADADFTNSKEVIKKIVPHVLENGLPHNICLNVNVPDVEKVKGIRVVRQAYGVWAERFDKRTDPHGQHYYWLQGEFKLLEDALDTDEWAIRNGYVSLVPTTIDTTAYKLLEPISKWEL